MSTFAKFHLEILTETQLMITEIKNNFFSLKNPFITDITKLCYFFYPLMWGQKLSI